LRRIWRCGGSIQRGERRGDVDSRTGADNQSAGPESGAARFGAKAQLGPLRQALRLDREGEGEDRILRGSEPAGRVEADGRVDQVEFAVDRGVHRETPGTDGDRGGG